MRSPRRRSACTSASWRSSSSCVSAVAASIRVMAHLPVNFAPRLHRELSEVSPTPVEKIFSDGKGRRVIGRACAGKTPEQPYYHPTYGVQLHGHREEMAAILAGEQDLRGD